MLSFRTLGQRITIVDPNVNDDAATFSTSLRLCERKYKEYICGEDALRISPNEPYCLRRPIRRGHLNISQHYSMQQVLEDLQTIWDWILTEKLNIPLHLRHMYAAILVVPETFDNRGLKLLRLLVQNRIVEFHTELELPSPNAVENPCILGRTTVVVLL
nr:actin-related protein 9 [Ipomoea batatas]